MQGAYHIQRRLEWTDHPYRVYRESISHSTEYTLVRYSLVNAPFLVKHAGVSGWCRVITVTTNDTPRGVNHIRLMKTMREEDNYVHK